MAESAPLEEAVEIFNDLVQRAPEEADALARLEWRLRSVVRARHGDPLPEVALLYALMMTGKAQEAGLLSDRIWHRKHLLGIEQLATYLIVLAQIGSYENATVLFDELRQHRASIPGTTNLDSIGVVIFWGLGDLDRLASTIAEASSPMGVWPAFIDEITEIGFAAQLAERQAIVREKTAGRQVFNQLVLTPGTYRAWQLSRYVYLNEDYASRLALEEEIRVSLDEHFKDSNLSIDHWELVNEIIVPIYSAPCWYKNVMLSAA